MHKIKIEVDKKTQQIFNAFMDNKIDLKSAVAQLAYNAKLSTKKLKTLIDIFKQ